MLELILDEKCTEGELYKVENKNIWAYATTALSWVLTQAASRRTLSAFVPSSKHHLLSEWLENCLPSTKISTSWVLNNQPKHTKSGHALTTGFNGKTFCQFKHTNKV